MAYDVRDFEKELGTFVDVVRVDPSLDEGGPRRMCIAVFHLLGHDHALVRRRRAELAAALYV